MNSNTPLNKILNALREHGTEPRLSGNDWMCRCPAHEDSTPSLSIREDKPGGRIFVKCFAGCKDTEVLKQLGLSVKDLFPEGDGVTSPSLSVRSGLKVEDLAAAKKLPADFLKSLGVNTTWLRKTLDDPQETVIQALVEPVIWEAMEFKSQWREVLIPYYNADGTQARPRRRMKLSGDRKHCWGPVPGSAMSGADGDGESNADSPRRNENGNSGGIIPYGLNRLQHSRDKGYLILVEGETDCWSLWLHEFPALGVPGASMVKTLKREHFDGIERVYLVQEPDSGGETFLDAVRSKLSSWKTWKGEMFVLKQPGGAKDVCDLRAREPEKFTAAMEELLSGAAPVPLEKADAKPAKPDAEKMKAALASSDIRPLTDLGNAERLVSLHGQDIRYCYEMDKWFVWTGKNWQANYATLERLAKDTVRKIKEEVHQIDKLSGLSAEDRESLKESILAHATHSESRPRINAMIELAKSEEGVQIHAADLDANHWLFNVQNGTIDLRTGELRPHDRSDLITFISGISFDRDAAAPRWDTFLHDIMDGDPEMVQFLRRTIGYCLTGEVSEQCMFFLWGSGSNGKSTFTETVQTLMGDLCHKSGTNLFTTSKTNTDDGRATPELSRLRGKRMVVTCELDIGKRVDEARVKDLTGSDTIVARGLFQDYIEFNPTHKLFVFGNHKPTVKGSDHGIWRRIRLIPFTVCFDNFPEKKDRNLKDKLLQELPGILNWAIVGCLEWQRTGLGIPDSVRKATDSYRNEMDVFGQFLNDRCVLIETATVGATALYNAYCEWAKDNREREISQRALGMILQERGFEKVRTMTKRTWKGLCLSPFDDRFGTDDADNDDEDCEEDNSPHESQNTENGNFCRTNRDNRNQHDASMTLNDGYSSISVMLQTVTDKEVNLPHDAYDAYSGKSTHMARAHISCARATNKKLSNMDKDTEISVSKRHASCNASCKEIYQDDHSPPSGNSLAGENPAQSDKPKTQRRSYG